MAKATPTTESPQQVTAFARQLHIAPRKMRLVTNALKNMRVTDALVQLQHMNKKGAPMVVKLLNSAIANAKNNFSLDPETLYIKSITTDMGNVLKRYFPRARGSAFIIRRKLAHVNVVLEPRKKSAAKKKTFGLFKREEKSAKEEHVTTGAETTAQTVAKEEPKKTKTIKTSEQKKMNTVANKRRLFNRKSGV